MPDARVAIAFSWHGDPDYPRIAAAGGHPGGGRSRRPAHQPLLLMIDGDIGKTMGRILTQELGLPGDLVSIDGCSSRSLISSMSGS